MLEYHAEAGTKPDSEDGMEAGCSVKEVLVPQVELKISLRKIRT